MKRLQTNSIVVHCSATPEGREVSVAEITEWHKARGFNTIGYHYVIHLDGTIDKGREEDQVGAHVQGYNLYSIGICLVGGVNANNRKIAKATYTEAQYKALKELLTTLVEKYPLAKILGHRDLDAGKACPCFNVKKWWATR